MAQTITINDPTDVSGAKVINGALLVTGNVTASGNITASNPSVGQTGSTIPGNATLVGFDDASGNLQPGHLGNSTAANSLSVVVATNQAAIPVNANITGGNVTATIAANASVNVAQVGGAAYALGNNTAANSQPVVIASNQASIPVTPAANSTVQVTNNVTTTIQANASVNVAQIGGAAYALGNNTAANSAPVVIATNQAAVPVTLPANITANVTNNVTTTIQANASVNLAQVGGTATVTGGVNGSQGVGGLAASGTAVAGSPVLQGGRAQTSEPSAVANAQAVDMSMDKTGKVIALPYANPENFIYGNATVANTTTANLTGMTAQGAGVKIYMTGLALGNTGNATVTAQLNDNNHSVFIVPSGGGNNLMFLTPLTFAANITANVTLSGNTTSVTLSAEGYTGV